MPAPVNSFKRGLKEGRLQIGLWQALGSPNTVEICAGAGYDWLLLDAEHGPSDVPRLAEQLRAARQHELDHAQADGTGADHEDKVFRFHVGTLDRVRPDAVGLHWPGRPPAVQAARERRRSRPRVSRANSGSQREPQITLMTFQPAPRK